MRDEQVKCMGRGAANGSSGRAPRSTGLERRVRMHNLGISLVALGQGLLFSNTQDELLCPQSAPSGSESLPEPTPLHLARMIDHFDEVVRIHKSSSLFRLQSAEELQRQVRLVNAGPGRVQGFIVMDLQGDLERMVVLFNAQAEAQRFQSEAFRMAHLTLHPVLCDSSDPIVRTATFHADTGTFTVPAHTTAVFMRIAPLS